MIQTLFIDWFQALEPQVKPYWVIAIVMSIVFIIQMVLTFIGIGDTDTDADFGAGIPDGADIPDGHADTLDTGGAVQLFTIRNTVNFLLGIGWGGVCFSGVIESPVLLAAVALVCGCALVAAFLVMLRQLLRLESQGSYRIRDAVGLTCAVYIPIPGSRKGTGKVQVSFHGSVQELPAVTDGDALPSGTQVVVTEIIHDSVLLVSRA
ncbi:MAG: hypothetical protein ACI4B5_02265 [Bacteroidaceae bacterium]